MDNATAIRSVYDNQEDILKAIIQLYCPDGFDLDPTYSKGVFYKRDIPEPRIKMDLNPQTSDTIPADSTFLPIKPESLSSIIFDPPFVGGSKKDGKPGIIKTRFGYYKNIPALWDMYLKTLLQFVIILKPSGILVFKCQDTIESGKQWLTHVEIINCCMKLDMYPRDLFILTAKARLLRSEQIQRHARKYHSYFLVFEKRKSPVTYSFI